MSKEYNTIIIGGGAAGMLAAILLARENVSTAIIEKNNKLGKKLLATGNGRCNFTNKQMGSQYYYGDDSFVQSVLNQFSNTDIIDFFYHSGMLYREKDGYYYPYSNQSKTVVERLKELLAHYGVDVYCNEKCLSVSKKDFFQVRTSNETIESEHLILATGSKASPELGGDGSGYQIARKFGHHVSDLFPALTGLTVDGNVFHSMAGVRLQGEISLWEQKRCLASETGEIQCTKSGVSGIPVFQVCRVAAEYLKNHSIVEGSIDFLPQFDLEGCASFIESQLGQMKVRDVLLGILHEKCVDSILERCPDKRDFKRIAYVLKNFKFSINGTAGFEKAQAVAGGVMLDEVSPMTMESKKCSCLYLLGEILDVDGICGGYNLQWAWSTAYVAATAILGKEIKI